MAETGNLIQHQWERRGVYDDPKLSELVAIYEELGFQVRCEPVDLQLDSECNECMKQSPERYQVLYTCKYSQ